MHSVIPPLSSGGALEVTTRMKVEEEILTVLMVISTENQKEHLLSFSTLFMLCEGTSCVAVAITTGFQIKDFGSKWNCL